MDLKYKIPTLTELKLELNYGPILRGEVLSPEKLGLSFEAKVRLDKSGRIDFFLHNAYFLKNENTDGVQLFHGDYLISIDIEGLNKRVKKKEIPQNMLAHLLGMSILMLRGAVSIRLSQSPLSAFNLPILNPLEILKTKLIVKDDKFVLEENRKY